MKILSIIFVALFAFSCATPVNNYYGLVSSETIQKNLVEKGSIYSASPNEVLFSSETFKEDTTLKSFKVRNDFNVKGGLFNLDFSRGEIIPITASFGDSFLLAVSSDCGKWGSQSCMMVARNGEPNTGIYDSDRNKNAFFSWQINASSYPLLEPNYEKIEVRDSTSPKISYIFIGYVNGNIVFNKKKSDSYGSVLSSETITVAPINDLLAIDGLTLKINSINSSNIIVEAL
jgi:hypothetical protein